MLQLYCLQRQTYWHLCSYSAKWVVYDPATDTMTEGLPAEVSKLLRRRYFLVEKARNANIVGKPYFCCVIDGTARRCSTLRSLTVWWPVMYDSLQPLAACIRWLAMIILHEATCFRP